MRYTICLALLCMSVILNPVWAQSPNILFAISDDQSFPHAGAYGCTWINTPAFDRVARDGILFSNAYTPNAKCAPSRACILTGRNSWQLEAAGNHMPYWPQKFKTYAETLGENGYHVGATQKTWAPGDPGTVNGKRRELCGKRYNTHKCRPPARAISGNDYAENFRQFLDERPAGKPFCFWYGSTEPHRAYEYGVGVNKGGKKLSQIDRVFPMWPDNEVTRNDMLDYAFEIEYFDSHLDRMLTLLKQRGELGNTLVVVTADNGMPFPRIKGQEYEYSNHLPLAIMWPKGIKRPGRTYEGFVSFIDFAPTYLELAGIDSQASGMQPITGHSLRDVFDDAVSVTRDHVLIGKEKHDVGRPGDVGYPIRGIVKGDYLLIHNYRTERWPAGNPETGYLNCDGSPTKTEILNMNRSGDNTWYWEMSFGKRSPKELYHRIEDPLCINNLAYAREHAARVAQLTRQMERELAEQQDPRMLGNEDIFDSYPTSSKHIENYYERYMAGEKVRAGWVSPADYEPLKPKRHVAPSPGGP
ncbi:MAG: sulfatase [Planctomycetes bacterium]|nr:sulfatase [Planctomycetota bacterium]